MKNIKSDAGISELTIYLNQNYVNPEFILNGKPLMYGHPCHYGLPLRFSAI